MRALAWVGMRTTPDAWVEHTREALARDGLRPGSARMAVVEVLSRQSCCLSARELSDRLRKDGQEVGLASVYRALELLDRMGLVQRLDTAEGTTRYEPALPGGEHHHHLVCDRCGAVAPFEDERLEREITRVSRTLEYRVQGHDVVLRGLCAQCSVGRGA